MFAIGKRLAHRWASTAAAAPGLQLLARPTARLAHTTHLVNVYCKPGTSEQVIAATLINCKSSTQEPGCLRFDLFQSADDDTHLIIEEMYETPEAAAAHKETEHYLAWRDAVAECMAQPRVGLGVKPLHVAHEAWMACRPTPNFTPTSERKRTWPVYRESVEGEEEGR